MALCLREDLEFRLLNSVWTVKDHRDFWSWVGLILLCQKGERVEDHSSKVVYLGVKLTRSWRDDCHLWQDLEPLWREISEKCCEGFFRLCSLKLENWGWKTNLQRWMTLFHGLGNWTSLQGESRLISDAMWTDSFLLLPSCLPFSALLCRTN